jgi:hopanoid biosynthesis associated RND transporter like protein HpnN
MTEIVGRIVELNRRYAAVVAALFLLLTGLGVFYVSRRIAIDSDTGKLVDPNLPWQKASADVARQFPQDERLLVAVVDAKTPDEASDTASALARALERRADLFSYVRRPDASPYFRRYGMLFLPEDQVQDFADHIIAAQPFLGTLAADPNPTGVLDAVDLLAKGGLNGAVDAGRIDPALAVVGRAARAALEGRQAPLSWQSMLGGRKASPGDLRHVVVARAALNFGRVDAASEAIAAIREAALAAGAVPGSGVTVRVTGPVALDNDQLAVLSDGAGTTAAIAIGLLLFWLFLGLRSLRAMAAVLMTLAAGLVGCLAFAVAVVGPFNPVSIAFVPLFVGIAIDFGIQFSVRHAAERVRSGEPDALRRSARGVGPPLTVAGVATAVGFLAFAPTSYLGVKDLGIIAGVGMILALGLNLTLLPALLTIMPPKARREAPGSSLGRSLDALLGRRRRWVLAAALLLIAAAAAALPRLKLDFNPLDLQNPNTESVRTLFDLMADPDASPYTIEFLAPREQAVEAADRLGRLPEVARALTLASFVPEDQGPKLEILADVASLLAPTLSPPSVRPPPAAAQVMEALRRSRTDLALLGAHGDAEANSLAAVFGALEARGTSAMVLLSVNLSAGIEGRLDDLREILRAAPVQLDTLPADFRRDWEAPDGRWRVQVFPKGDTRDNAVLRHFAQSVRAVVPQATGSAVEVDEWTQLAPRAFATAGALAVAAISLLLLAVLRSARDAALVLVPLLTAGVLTLGSAAFLGFSINFANIITLPMMLGIGVAFDIYFVMRWRAGEPGFLGSPTATGIVFSALTTGTAFGSLVFSRSPGMSEMGKFLSLALLFTLLCTLFVLPALLGGRKPLGKGAGR